MAEYLYIASKNNKPTKKRIARIRVHQKGLWHRAVHVWIINSRGEILCNLRSSKKDVFPNYWDLVCGGHIKFGEKYENAALRELKEEFGITVVLEDLINLGIYKYVIQDKERNVINREFCKVYCHRTTKRFLNFKFQKSEISKIKFIRIKDLKKILQQKNPKIKLVPQTKYYLSAINKIEKLYFSDKKVYRLS